MVKKTAAAAAKKPRGESRKGSKKARSAKGGAGDLHKAVQRARRWLIKDARRQYALGAVLLMAMLMLVSRRGRADAVEVLAAHGSLRESAFDPYGDGGEAEEEETPKEVPQKRKKKETPALSPAEVEEDLAAATGIKNPIERAIKADQYHVKMRPLVKRDDQVWCPDKGGGKQNKVCSKAYAEYLFDVPKPDTYYLYVETVAPNINDNSLWVGAPGLDAVGFASCPASKAGPLVPHKHVKSKKWLCCPKYLEGNAKKGQGRFYCECCISTIGPKDEDIGCILDLEVGTKWNMLPRALKVTNAAEPLALRLYAREDGTAWRRLFMSTNPLLATIPA